MEKNNFIQVSIKTWILALLIALLIFCISLFWTRFLYQEGIKQLKLKNYDKAIHYFDRAEKKMPHYIAGWFAQADVFRIYTNYGQALYHSGIKHWRENGLSKEAFQILEAGKSYLTKAGTISPMHYQNSYWIILIEEALEKGYSWLFPEKPNPYNTYSLYQKTLSLRPAGSSIRYAYIRYLNWAKRYTEIALAIENLMAISPRAYYQLKKEPFFSEKLLLPVEKGLFKALEDNIQVGTTAKVLSNLYEKKQDFTKAVLYYDIYLQQKITSKTAQNYIHLGRLYLNQDKEALALEAFETSFKMAGNIADVLNRIYRTLKTQKKQDVFFPFVANVLKKGIQMSETSVALASIHIDMKQYGEAKDILNRIIVLKENASTYALLANIAFKQKNWNEMELSAQKAILLDQDNSKYYYTLAQALMYQQKYKRAEQEVSKAIQYTPKENPWYYHFRAQTRWIQKKYALAVADWEKAYKLMPERSDFAYRIAKGCEKLDQFEKARTYIGIAVSLEPANKKYNMLKKRLHNYR